MFDDYTIITGQSQTDVIGQVKAQMREGWQPLGGLAIAGRSDRNGVYFSQAMGKAAPMKIAAPVKTIPLGTEVKPSNGGI
jgi:hypothetical protein